jgi:2-methylisocitrate lyase-like PEP mutase family enzyme
MSTTLSQKRSSFRALHASGCFLLPNPWDIGSARLFQSLGFEALATTSTGFAWTLGLPDYAVTLEGVLKHLSDLSKAVDLPINADFESGFGKEPEAVAENVKSAIQAGVAGLSIEDRVFGDLNTLYDTNRAVERIAAVRSAIDATGEDVILVARTEGLLTGGKVSAAIDKLVAMADAGADCLYAPGLGMTGLTTKEDVISLVKAVAPKPVNVLVMGPGNTVAEYADMGVRRISVGGALAQVAWAAVLKAAEELKAGALDGLSSNVSGTQLNNLFAHFASDGRKSF